MNGHSKGFIMSFYLTKSSSNSFITLGLYPSDLFKKLSTGTPVKIISERIEGN
jgi:hypothetical protein